MGDRLVCNNASGFTADGYKEDSFMLTIRSSLLDNDDDDDDDDYYY